MTFALPRKITAGEALKLIAQSRHVMGGPGLSKADMVNLARVACRTEGITWEGWNATEIRQESVARRWKRVTR